jgi:hypothetical protein
MDRWQSEGLGIEGRYLIAFFKATMGGITGSSQCDLIINFANQLASERKLSR